MDSDPGRNIVHPISGSISNASMCVGCDDVVVWLRLVRLEVAFNRREIMIQYIGYEMQLMHLHGRIESSETARTTDHATSNWRSTECSVARTFRSGNLLFDSMVISTCQPDPGSRWLVGCRDHRIDPPGVTGSHMHAGQVAVVGWKCLIRIWCNFFPQKIRTKVSCSSRKIADACDTTLERGVEDVRVHSMMNLLITGVRTPGWRGSNHFAEPVSHTCWPYPDFTSAFSQVYLSMYLSGCLVNQPWAPSSSH